MSNELTLQERLDLFEMTRQERWEIESEILAELDAKGYPIAVHMTGRPCYSCTISRLVDKLQVQDAT